MERGSHGIVSETQGEVVGGPDNIDHRTAIISSSLFIRLEGGILAHQW